MERRRLLNAMKTMNVGKPPAFDGRDLAACQPVFDTLLREAGVTRESEEAARIAALVVELYRQGVSDPDRLRSMVEGARGLFKRAETSGVAA